MKKIILFSIFAMLLTHKNNLLPANPIDLKKVESGDINLIGTDLIGANLSGKILYWRRFNYAHLNHTRFWHAYLWHSDFSNAHLDNAIFEDAEMIGTIFKNTTAQDADFKNAKGLTNAQKKYLREHGALNVPPDIDENVQYKFEPGYLIILFQKAYNLTKNQSLKLYRYLRRNNQTLQTQAG